MGKMPEKGPRPKDIPSNPNVIYKGKGWKSYGHWLGTGTVAPGLRVYRSFESAREFVRSLGLKSRAWWEVYVRNHLRPHLPKDIPANPSTFYRNKGWKGWGDWLGTGTMAPGFKKYRPFNLAREFARGLDLKKGKEWTAYVKGRIPGKPPLPKDIPLSPYDVFKSKGWTSWGDWLGTGNVAVFLRKYRSFEPARKFAHRLGLHSQSEWQAYVQGQVPGKPPLPDDIPRDPYSHYRKNKVWISWRNWLGTEGARRKKYHEPPRRKKFGKGLRQVR